MVNLSVKIGKLKLSNPILVASGTFGYGEEFGDLIDLSKLGAIVTKTIKLKSHQGNPMPRTIETPCGLLNSIGLQNSGIDDFIKRKGPALTKLPTQVIVSITAESAKEFKKLAEVLNRQRFVDAIELNISCPNIKDSKKLRTTDYGLRTKLIAQDPKATYRVVKAVRGVTPKTLITKLSPNVTDIVRIAKASQEMP